MKPVRRPTLDEIVAAQERLAGVVMHSPLLRLAPDDAPGSAEPRVWLKLENLQPIGSYKLRCAGNALALADPDELARGVYTASAGNWAQGQAFWAGRMGVECTILVPEHAPATKVAAIERLGGRVVRLPFDAWWQVIIDHHHEGSEGAFIHPVASTEVVAGNGTLGLEILEDLPTVATIVVPYGGGALSTGVAAAVKAKRDDVRVFAAEVETAAPLSASFAAGAPATIQHVPSFVDGIGGRSVLAELWPLARDLLDGSLVVSVAQAADAVRRMVHGNRVVAEGAGAVSVAAALDPANRKRLGDGDIVCVVSGGNIDADKLAIILGGGVP